MVERTDDAENYTDRLDSRLSDIEAAAREHGAWPIRAFRDREGAAADYADEDYLRIDQMVETLITGVDLGSRLRRDVSDGTVIKLHDQVMEPWVYAYLAKYVCGSFLIGLRATHTLLNWSDDAGQIDDAFSRLAEFEESLSRDGSHSDTASAGPNGPDDEDQEASLLS